MQQLEIEYFFPLTEQISLDLDYTSCEQYEKEKQERLLSGSILYGDGLGIGNYATTNSFVFQTQGGERMRIDAEGNFHIAPQPNKVGYWEVTKDFWVYTEKKPNIITRLMTKAAFGWNWKAK